MNIRNILTKSIIELDETGINTAGLDARVLLGYVLEKDSSNIFSHPEMPLTNAQYSKFRRLINRRKRGEPVAYLTGHKEFYGHNFFVNKNVLIPRPETELLVEQAIKFVKSKVHKVKSDLNIIDVGTGSGCIIISLALKARSCKLKVNLFASDISKKALYVARKNAEFYQVDKNIRFFHSDLFSNKQMPKKYDIIIANLPYVPLKAISYKLENRNLKYEPKDAIFAKDDGAEIIKRFLDQAKTQINKNGLILIEVDPRNARGLKKYAKNIFPKSKIELIKDLAKFDRVIRILN